MRATPTPPLDILEFGEDGEWFAAVGHVDLDNFRAAVLDHARDCWGDAEELLPTAWDTEPKHTWYRPVEFADCMADVAHSYPGRPAPERHGLAEKMLEARLEDGWVYPCAGDHVDAEAWTEWRA